MTQCMWKKKLAILEDNASKLIRYIIETSQIKSQIVLLRKYLFDLRKFLFIMDYRKPHRRNQFADKYFDIETWSMIESFMQKHNLQNPQEVWLQNVREIIDSPHEDFKDNTRIFSVDKTDYGLRMIGWFVAIWQAGDNDEFIMTNNSFGIFEALVLCDCGFKKEIGFDALDKIFGSKHRTLFQNVPHPPPITEYADLKDGKVNLNNNDKFTITFIKVNSAAVHLVNSIVLNESKPYLQVSFLSLSYLYKTIVKYNKNVKEIDKFKPKDFSNMKKTLFMRS
ncbi:25993_t:CDS:2 [Dentiscutata erythropus]|uniref:25993_t:CDS:1 n=1 Tax=Dentiscutata erythropus TaxID=1348616 RepID=A0A9N9NAE0_9GLOM|nr:25993_t:CDS:2 [Dentiscutata erythropus]